MAFVGSIVVRPQIYVHAFIITFNSEVRSIRNVSFCYVVISLTMAWCTERMLVVDEIEERDNLPNAHLGWVTP